MEITEKKEAPEMKESKEQIQRRQSIQRFLSYDQEKMIDLFALAHDQAQMRIDLLGRSYAIDRQTGELYRESLGGTPADLDEMASIYELLTRSEHVPAPTGRWESIASLCTNTTDTSLTRYIDYLRPFNGDLALMRRSLEKLGAEPAAKGDVSAVLEVFKGVPVWFQYWEADDEFPASIQFLFDEGITDHFRWSILWNVMTCITTRMKEEAGLL